MTAIRHLLQAHRRLASLICAATLLLKLLVPGGYMVAGDQGRLTITICSGVAPRTMTMDMPAMHGDAGSDHRDEDGHAGREMPCAFAGLSAAVLDTIDPIQLAALIAFVLALGLGIAIPPVLSPAPRLRPPLRGPPA